MDISGLTACDREPIHIPGAIQPHGLLLIVDPERMVVEAGAGNVEARLSVDDFVGRPLDDILPSEIAARAHVVAARRSPLTYVGLARSVRGELLDVTAHLSGDRLIVELEPGDGDGAPPGVLLNDLETVAAAFEDAPTLEDLCRVAAVEFRRLAGYDRVMIYRFLDDESGSVVAEDRREDLRSFLNHRFPASDIPKQARALYLRNPIRVIPDIDYEPAPVRPSTGPEPLDLSDASLRSVSPIHLQYLRNMGVAASASVSIVKDGTLWGLVACHNDTPRTIPYAVRGACRALGGALARQIKVKDETDAFRERVRLRSFQDDLVSLLSREGSLHDAISNHVDEIRRAFGGDGVVILRGPDLLTNGRCPSYAEIREIAAWALPRSVETVFATDRLSSLCPPAQSCAGLASGLLSITLSTNEPWQVIWLRAEEIETIEWAGNPHKDGHGEPGAVLTPRASFEVWRERVSGRSRRWTTSELEAAGRLRSAVVEVWQARRLRELNRRLVATIDEKDLLIQQKEFLIGEVNHRVQNSLQLVSSFLALQARGAEIPELSAALEEARRRLTAVALVHRRLYRADQVESVDAARYVEELVADISSSIGDDWAAALSLDLAPVLLPTDRAISLGLILTELVINATKYAYGGAAGPLSISLYGDRANFRLVVADRGAGRPAAGRRGFGSRMIDALVRQLGGELTYEANMPGLKITLTATAARQA
ncbi:MAG TPA: histidine kinase dimerization/phosphoacceptor domain -containing protein [Hansschlegelia sp.]